MDRPEYRAAKGKGREEKLADANANAKQFCKNFVAHAARIYCKKGSSSSQKYDCNNLTPSDDKSMETDDLMDAVDPDDLSKSKHCIKNDKI
ncbi:hypothetical protein EC973_005669 [Apophysomyces ossiformis]|uniref:Uncharacterized protein n=1 Tax=Apophysomyces ossiformis TaxID=679940 RepID=A0A8H7BET7_9FUNG|nr:hypothetical protein EC973_005669 [Apophysomyces ossiformis]